MKNVFLKIPRKDELFYRQEWMKDPNTMNYNSGYDIELKGYNKENGTIVKTNDEMIEWYDKWIDQEPDKYFAYIYDFNYGKPVGEVYYYLDGNIHSMGILISEKYRGMGYSYPALLELEKMAFEKNNISELSDIIPIYRESAIKSFEKAGFVKTNEIHSDIRFGKEAEAKQLLITKDMYFNRK
jgi:diamine N-acetyltransferase